MDELKLNDEPKRVKVGQQWCNGTDVGDVLGIMFQEPDGKYIMQTKWIAPDSYVHALDWEIGYSVSSWEIKDVMFKSINHFKLEFNAQKEQRMDILHSK